MTKATKKVVDEIKAERLRQITQEEWDANHDDDYMNGELAQAAAAYACFYRCLPWPWNDGDKRYKHPHRRRLVIAAALLIAEIERMDRVAEVEGGV